MALAKDERLCVLYVASAGLGIGGQRRDRKIWAAAVVSKAATNLWNWDQVHRVEQTFEEQQWQFKFKSFEYLARRLDGFSTYRAWATGVGIQTIREGKFKNKIASID